MYDNDRLELIFDGTSKDRNRFLVDTRKAIISFVDERMTLDALLIEILKNIFDHANGIGKMVIVRNGDSFAFEVSDSGTGSYDYDFLKDPSKYIRDPKPGNHGTGLRIILDNAEHLNVQLHIDTSCGFTYKGIYTKKPSQ